MAATQEQLDAQEDKLHLSRQYPWVFPEIYDYCPAVYDPGVMCWIYKRAEDGKGS